MKIQIINDKNEVTELSENDTGNFVQNLKNVVTALTEIQTISANSEIGSDQISQINSKAADARANMLKKVARSLGVKLD